MNSERIDCTESHAPQMPSATRYANSDVSVSLLTGGLDPHYAGGLACALAEASVRIDFLGSDALDLPFLRSIPGLTFLNLRCGQKEGAGVLGKLGSLALYYMRLLCYAAVAKPPIFHILWNSRVEIFDRTLLMLYYRVLGKKIAITVHNVNSGRRDGSDSFLNRATLRFQYCSADQLFVHTHRMKQELVGQFHVRESRITVIPYPINSIAPETGMTTSEARRRLQIDQAAKIVLFFGAIKPYKGLEDLVAAFEQLVVTDSEYRLVIAGSPKKEFRQYAGQIARYIKQNLPIASTLTRMEFIPDDEMEMYFKAADVLVLPYKDIFQSGVLFLAYNYGLPVIATDVGSLREDILEGETGYVCPPNDGAALVETIQRYFSSNLFKDLGQRRPAIREYAFRAHSWNRVAELTCDAYLQILNRPYHHEPANQSKIHDEM